MKFTKVFRKLLAEKLMDLGNLTVGALTLGQFVSGKEFSGMLFSSGVIFALLCYMISYMISR